MLMAKLVRLAQLTLELGLGKQVVLAVLVSQPILGADFSVQLLLRHHLDSPSQLRLEALAPVAASLAHKSLPPAGCSGVRIPHLLLQPEGVFLVLQQETRVVSVREAAVLAAAADCSAAITTHRINNPNHWPLVLPLQRQVRVDSGQAPASGPQTTPAPEEVSLAVPRPRTTATLLVGSSNNNKHRARIPLVEGLEPRIPRPLVLGLPIIPIPLEAFSAVPNRPQTQVEACLAIRATTSSQPLGVSLETLITTINSLGGYSVRSPQPLAEAYLETLVLIRTLEADSLVGDSATLRTRLSRTRVTASSAMLIISRSLVGFSEMQVEILAILCSGTRTTTTTSKLEACSDHRISSPSSSRPVACLETLTITKARVCSVIPSNSQPNQMPFSSHKHSRPRYWIPTHSVAPQSLVDYLRRHKSMVLSPHL